MQSDAYFVIADRWKVDGDLRAPFRQCPQQERAWKSRSTSNRLHRYGWSV